jgi:2-succinyl-5-enolpyruvyl-6-hydroxy-3-cyclohexene-1-carboxylate synthase
MRSVASRAYAAARGEPRPGPVHLNVPWRDPLAPEPREGEVTATSRLALEGRGDRPLTAVTAALPAPEPPLLDELAERIAAAPRGLIVAGRQADPGLATLVAALARAASYPILAEPTSQLRLGAHDRDLVVWPYDAIARLRPEQLEPELVLRFGDMPTSRSLREWLRSLGDLRQVVIDPYYGWNEPSRRAETVVRADPGGLASGLADRLAGPGEGSPWASSWLEAGRASASAIEHELGSLDRPTEPGAHATLGRLYADGELVYTASSMPIRDQEAFLPSRPARVRFLCNRGANGIDGLLSSAIGAAAASGSPTWIVIGDLGLYHDMNGLAALGEAGSPVRIVVLNNGGGGIFEFLPQSELVDREEFEALFATPLPMRVERVAELYGVPYAPVEELDRLEDVATRDRVIAELPVDRVENVGVHRRLAGAVAEALGTARGI